MTVYDGVRLGIYQGNALAGPIAAAVMASLGYVVLSLIFGVAALLGWVGWWRDFRLAWTIPPGHIGSPVEYRIVDQTDDSVLIEVGRRGGGATYRYWISTDEVDGAR